LKTSEVRNSPQEEQPLKIESTEFGSITIEGKTYQFDVVIRSSGEVIKRKKKLSKMHYGTSHKISKDEAKFVYEKGATNSFWVPGSTTTSGCRRRRPTSSKERVASSSRGGLPMPLIRTTRHRQRRKLACSM
jgi:hypothetical protein